MNACLETPIGDNQAAPDDFNDEVIRSTSRETLTVILSDYPFYCNGTVRSWSLRLRVFQRLLRRDNCSLSFQISTLRGEYNFSLMAEEDNDKVSLELNGQEGIIELNSSDVLPDQRIEVQAGDVLGLVISPEFVTRRFCRYALIGQENTNGTIMYQKGDDGTLRELRAWPFIAVLLGMCIRVYTCTSTII